MMKVFGDLSGIEYPYEKYDQIIVDNFMFGGMENITLTHNTDRTMYDEFAAPDVSSEGLVAHELAHQWYGDMLTTKTGKIFGLTKDLQPSFLEFIDI